MKGEGTVDLNTEARWLKQSQVGLKTVDSETAL